MYPLKFKPVYKDYIWGGRNLEKYKNDLPYGIVAESWEISGHPDGISIVSNGIFSGKSLPELMATYGKELLGNNVLEKDFEKFPLLVKFIDANDRLSVQVHPDDKYAKDMENGEYGKNEMWYVMSALPGAKIVYDVVPGTDRNEFQECINKNMIDKCLKYVEVSAGDTIYIPAGVIHAVGKGIVIAEIQQNSNLTYRIYDYDRIDKSGNKRALHVKKALDVIDFRTEKRKEKYTGLEIKVGTKVKRTYKIANEYFCVEVYEADGTIKEFADGRGFCIYVFLEGSAIIGYKYGNERVERGESILIPACLGQYEINGTFKAIKTYVPEVRTDVIEPLISSGYSINEIYEYVGGISR